MYFSEVSIGLIPKSSKEITGKGITGYTGSPTNVTRQMEKGMDWNGENEIVTILKVFDFFITRKSKYNSKKKESKFNKFIKWGPLIQDHYKHT